MTSGGHNRKSSGTRQSRRDYTTPAPAGRPEPPDGLSAAGLAAFATLAAAMPPGAAGKSDSTALGIAAELLAQWNAGPDTFPAGKLATLRQFLSDFGLTPAGRRRLELVATPAENPFAAIDRLRGGG
jgi:hypothetical protein